MFLLMKKTIINSLRRVLIKYSYLLETVSYKCKVFEFVSGDSVRDL